MPVTFVENDGGQLTIDQTKMILDGDEVQTTGWWNAIQPVDLDGDGDQDYVIGNLGTNYKYKATQEEPFSVHYEDFDSNGKKDIVLSYYNFGEKYPLRGRSCSAEQIPILNEEFPSYDIFAGSSLTDVYNINSLDNALNYDAFMFESICLYNNSESKFSIEVLPNQAQISCINSVLPLGQNSDGIECLLTAGNMYQSEVETPRNDASIGALLKKADDGWMFEPSMTSNVYLSHDVRHLIKLQVGDKNCVLVVSNDDSLRLFEISN